MQHDRHLGVHLGPLHQELRRGAAVRELVPQSLSGGGGGLRGEVSAHVLYCVLVHVMPLVKFN